MIAFLQGKVAGIKENALLLEVNGVGFQILMPLSALQEIKSGETLLIHTYLAHKEEAMLLYGFLSEKEKSLFTKVINVSGVGPKTGLAILSVLSVERFCQAIIEEDVKTISSVPGIGLKIAQRLILELQTKIKKEMEISPFYQRIRHSTQNNSDAVAALVALGYQQTMASKAVNEVESNSPKLNLQDLIRESLKLLMKQ
ncbi:MAG TPA: Holliday junction branch migration protein RuvA [Firmicutes bacterium]|jgi:Holliday junction DNA helicase RuvA|nr:Holliday junction branch migration protein RuvA [Bacillota bacterium]HBK69110.1 Holliday junction branch migration protein RuvA [Bacillota bacterium]